MCWTIHKRTNNPADGQQGAERKPSRYKNTNTQQVKNDQWETLDRGQIIRAWKEKRGKKRIYTHTHMGWGSYYCRMFA